MIFPDFLNISANVEIKFNTIINQDKGSKETRYPDCLPSRNIFMLDSLIINEEEKDSIIAFFRIMQGQLNSFYFKDFFDFSGTEEFLGVTDGLNDKFQLQKKYFFENKNNAFTRNIANPIKETVQIFLDNIAIYDFQVNEENGEVTLDFTPKKDAVVTASFEFNLIVRFNSDSLSIIKINNNSYQIENLELIEVV